MSSGKISKLVKYAKRLSQDYPEKVILPYLPKVDTRTPPGTVNSRDGSILGLVQPIGHCVEINCSPNGSYYIDEVQFCDKTIFDLIIYIAQNQNCGFVAAGLDLDFKTCRFGLTFDLLNFMNSWTLDHEVYFLKAVCKMCGSPACFTGRIASSSELILIGGDELYNPVCQNHFSSRTHIE